MKEKPTFRQSSIDEAEISAGTRKEVNFRLKQ